MPPRWRPISPWSASSGCITRASSTPVSAGPKPVARARAACSRCAVTRRRSLWSTARSSAASSTRKWPRRPRRSTGRESPPTTRARASSCRSISAAADRRELVRPLRGGAVQGRNEQRFPNPGALLAELLNDKDITDRSGLGVFQRLLILRRLVAGLRHCERVKANDDVACPPAALELHAIAATSKKDTAMSLDGLRGGACVLRIGLRVAHVGTCDPQRAHDVAPIIFLTASKAASAFSADFAPPWARSGRPPPPLPPRASTAVRTRSTAE